MNLNILDIEFSICKVSDYSQLDISGEFIFTGRTDEENSLVCPTACVPANTLQRDDGWKAFRIQGILDLSLTGILSRISGILAEEKIGIFAVSTFNTDYVLVRDVDIDRAARALENEGYRVTRTIKAASAGK